MMSFIKDNKHITVMIFIKRGNVAFHYPIQ